MARDLQLGGATFTLCDLTLTTALSESEQTEILDLAGADWLGLQAVFTYGSGGTSAKAYIQTSLDGTTWIDIASFAFATTTATKISAVTSRIAPGTQAFAPDDAALADNTVINGVIGDRLRAKVTTVGTYAGGTTLVITGFVRS